MWIFLCRTGPASYFCGMTGIDSVQMDQVIVHRIGNPTRGEALQLSPNALTLNDPIVRGLLVKYFLSPFNDQELHHFTHLSDLTLNEVYQYVSVLFRNPGALTEQSHLIARFLYGKSTHVKVKEGELYVARFSEVPFEGETVSAIGIFKSETKETFLKVFPHGQSWEVIHEEGIDIRKLDKGCLILQSGQDEGYKVCLVDATAKQDTQYWVREFLQVTPYADSYHNTHQYLDLCKDFIKNEYPEKFDVAKSDQIELMNKSMDYFKNKEQFSETEFTDEVLFHPEIKDSFMEYKKHYENARQYELGGEFDIHGAAVQKQSKMFKAILKLDKNFHVYIHGRRDLIEKGYDEMTGKKYYKLFFDEEK
jgi:hypothetical protein